MWNGHRPLVPCALPRLRTRWFLLHIHSLILVLASQRKGRFLRRPRWRPRVVDLLTCGYFVELYLFEYVGGLQVSRFST